ncbi:hypothetical protein V1478_010826 [Vespula squamosa]|uniref:Uncharacterized protein n=1 Tax=Vespula squamosa TaxID=30214 RepID=A0ABD2AFH1_VESSQ
MIVTADQDDDDDDDVVDEEEEEEEEEDDEDNNNNNNNNNNNIQREKKIGVNYPDDLFVFVSVVSVPIFVLVLAVVRKIDWRVIHSDW